MQATLGAEHALFQGLALPAAQSRLREAQARMADLFFNDFVKKYVF
jgi:hypothetical protein